MKKLQKEFTGNFDRVGNTKFIQLKKENGVAIYERQNMDGSFRSYEVFVVKVIEKGTALPGGNSVQETFERMPAFIHTTILVTGVITSITALEHISP